MIVNFGLGNFGIELDGSVREVSIKEKRSEEEAGKRYSFYLLNFVFLPANLLLQRDSRNSKI